MLFICQSNVSGVTEKDILKAHVIFFQYVLSRLCIILHGSLCPQLHGHVPETVASKMRAIMAGLGAWRQNRGEERDCNLQH